MTGAEAYDVVVVGGGAAGVGAAVGAARAGARVLLVERGPCLGGAATQKNVMTYCGIWTQADPPEQAVHGVAELALEELRGIGGVEERYRVPPFGGTPSTVIALLDPEAVKLALDRVCERAGVEVLFGTTLIDAARSGDRIDAVRLADHGGRREVPASVFVDASGEGDLAAFGGASVRYGNHLTAQAGTLSVRFGGVSAEADISTARWAQAIHETRAAGVPGLDKEHGLVFRLPISGDLMTLYIDETYDALDAASTSRVDRVGRERAQSYLRAMRTIPGCERAFIASTGPEFGTRESRHMTGRCRVTEHDVTTGARFEDAVALGAWPVEHHPADGGPVEWERVKDDGVFDIPLRTLLSADTANLLAAGRLVDGDEGGGGAMRVMGTAFATGHAAGVAAALGGPSDGFDPAAIRAELERQGARLSL